jgi:hypothetical protein
MKITPELRNALRECEGTYMPIQPALKRPTLLLPAAFTEWSVGKALLDNQVQDPHPAPQTNFIPYTPNPKTLNPPNPKTCTLYFPTPRGPTPRGPSVMPSASSTWTGPNPLNVAAPAARSASSLQGLSPQPSSLNP